MISQTSPERQVSVRFSAADFDRLRQAAARDQRPVAQFVRVAVWKQLDQAERAAER